jgi:hypothetical protein
MVTFTYERAESKNLDIFSDSLDFVCCSAKGGQVAALEWVKYRGMLTTQESRAQALLCREAVSNCHLQVLDWLLENSFDYERIEGIAVYAATTELGVLTAELDWAKDHGYVFAASNEAHCIIAAGHGNLPALQWLRQNNCPWEVGVINTARDGGHLDFVCRLGDCPRWLS